MTIRKNNINNPLKTEANKIITPTNDKISKNDTQERIIKAVIELIGQKGNIKITIREICKKANVNLAAINYYFRSSKNLFIAIEDYFTEEINSLYKVLEKNNKDSKEKIMIWSIEFMNFLYQNSGILWLIANKIIKKDFSGTLYESIIQNKNLPLYNLIKDATKINDEAIITAKMVQIISGIVGPLIMFYGIGQDFNFDLRNKELRKFYVSNLLETILSR